MASLDKFNENPQKQLLEHLKEARCVMLGTPHTDAHMQPMTPQVDVKAQDIYFYSSKSSDLGRAVLSQPGTVHMCLVEDDYQACIKGYLISHDDPETVEKYWSGVVAAWFLEGQKDKDLMMFKFVPHDASIWASDKNLLTFTYEIAKANIMDKRPDIGEQKNVELRPEFAH